MQGRCTGFTHDSGCARGKAPQDIGRTKAFTSLKSGGVSRLLRIHRKLALPHHGMTMQTGVLERKKKTFIISLSTFARPLETFTAFNCAPAWYR